MFDIMLALHVISVISWMAGLLYLPRLYVYHTERKEITEILETFKTMEFKLLYYITIPAGIASWIFGIILIVMMGGLSSYTGWLHTKLLLLVLLTIFNLYLIRWYNMLKNNKFKHSGKFYRIANEVPTILMIFIVLLVVIKPF